MKTIYYIIIAILLSNVQLEALNRIDSLEMVIMKNEFQNYSSEVKFETYFILANDYKNVFIGKALSNAILAFDIAKKGNDKELLLKTNVLMGEIYFLSKEYKKSVEKYKLVLEELSEKDEEYANLLIKYGISQFNQGDYKATLNTFLELKSLGEKLKNTNFTAVAYFYLGRLYFNLKAYNQSEVEFKSALEIFKKFNENKYQHSIEHVNTFLAKIYYNRGDIKKAESIYLESIKNLRDTDNKYNLILALKYYSEILKDNKDYEKSLKFLDESIILAKEIKSKGILTELYSRKGHLYYDKKDYEKSLECNLKALDIRKKTGQQSPTQSSTINIAFDYLGLKDTVKAKALLISAFNYSLNDKFNKIRLRSSKKLSEIYKAENDYKNALKYYTYYSNLLEKIHNNSQKIEIKNSHLLYNLEKEKAEKLTYSTKLQRLINILFASFVFMIIILVIFIFKRYKKKKSQNIELSKEKEILKGSLSKLAESKKEISNYKNVLEEEVQKRTIELETVNKKLNDLLSKEKVLVELKTKFVNMISHEYRTPLTVIFSSMEIIDQLLRKNPNKEIENYIDRIKTSLKNMTDLLDKVLFAKAIEENEYKTNYTEIKIETILHKINNNFAAQTSHQLVYDNKLSIKSLVIDQVLLFYILNQLVENAIKYSPSANKVNINLKNDKKYIYIEVVDNGVGMTEEDLDKIKDPLHRGANVSNISGFGLGLYNVFNSVKKLNAKLDIRSKLNYGSTFELKLPIKQ